MPARSSDSDNLRLRPEDRATIFKPFTVLAVAFVLAVVAAVLLPIFARRTGGHGPEDSCSNNLRQCAIALQIYCEEYNGCLPSSAIVSGSKKWNKADFAHFATRLRHVPVPTNTSPNTWTQALYPYVRNKHVVFCPDDRADRAAPNSRVSYYWKTAIDKGWYGIGCKKPHRKLTDSPNAADQIVLYERAGFHDQQKRFLRSPIIPGLKNGVRINVAYLDSHVRSVAIVNATDGNPDRPELASNGEPMYFNFDQSKPKGPGNPPAADILANHTDPSRYSDRLP